MDKQKYKTLKELEKMYFTEEEIREFDRAELKRDLWFIFNMFILFLILFTNLNFLLSILN